MTRAKLLSSIAATIQDYRQGDLTAPTPDHVDRWVRQFDNSVQLPILNEMDHVLKKTYLSREKTIGFLNRLFRTKELVGNDPCSFWNGVEFLDIQGGGASQTQMLTLFRKILENNCGFCVNDCSKSASTFFYIDDATFTGSRIKQDLEGWVSSEAPAKATVHIIVIGMHTGAKYYVENYGKSNIHKSTKNARKDIVFKWWYDLLLEDQRNNTDSSDVLRPTIIPSDAAVQAYVNTMTHKPHLRTAGQVGKNKIFSSDQARQLLEGEFLKAGVRIRQVCPNLNKFQRPLGNMILDTLGFGSLIVTFRNCPNNAPLALWAGDPWYPLFPRVTNSETATRRFMELLAKDGWG